MEGAIRTERGIEWCDWMQPAPTKYTPYKSDGESDKSGDRLLHGVLTSATELFSTTCTRFWKEKLRAECRQRLWRRLAPGPAEMATLLAGSGSMLARSWSGRLLELQIQVNLIHLHIHHSLTHSRCNSELTRFFLLLHRLILLLVVCQNVVTFADPHVGGEIEVEDVEDTIAVVVQLEGSSSNSLERGQRKRIY